MNNVLPGLLLTVALTAFASDSLLPRVRAADAGATVPLALNLPHHTEKGTPEDLPVGPNIEPPPKTAPKPIQVPAGVVNVAAGKPVTGSVRPYTGELAQVTDGKKEPFDEDVAEFKKGTQWVQVDLGQPYAIYAIVMWHDHRVLQAYHDVIVQVSDDAEFKNGVTTLFNNDTDNSSKQGVGTDREYFELEWGRVVPAKGVKARYVRSYSKGSSLSAINCWQELEVYALPAK
jgi:F5/8 type C domain-containing protein